MRTYFRKRYVLNKIWKDPVWSKVIAGFILFIITTYVFNRWLAQSKFIARFVNLVISSTSISNWILILIFLFVITTIIIFAFGFRKILQSRKIAQSWQSYTTDIFFGLRWRWKYFNYGVIGDIATYCPHCDFQVDAVNVSAYIAVDHIEFYCECCGRHLCEFHESFSSLENQAKRHIQQKIRNGTWHNQDSA